MLGFLRFHLTSIDFIREGISIIDIPHPVYRCDDKSYQKDDQCTGNKKSNQDHDTPPDLPAIDLAQPRDYEGCNCCDSRTLHFTLLVGRRFNPHATFRAYLGFIELNFCAAVRKKSFGAYIKICKDL